MAKIMKNKILPLFVLAILAIATIVNAGTFKATTLSATAALSSGEGYLSHVSASLYGTSGSFTLYDYGTNNSYSTTTELKLLPSYGCTTSETGLFYYDVPINPPVHFMAGLYAVISSTVELTVHYAEF